MKKEERLVLNEEIERVPLTKKVHLSDALKDIHFDSFILVENINDVHYSTDKSLDEDYEEDEDEEYSLLDASDDILKQLSKEEIASFTNIELLGKIAKIDSSKLTAEQLKKVQELFKQKHIISEHDVEMLIEKFKECNTLHVSTYGKVVSFKKKYNLEDKDILDIIHNLKVEDYYASTNSINLNHLGNDLVIFEPTVDIKGVKVKITLYIKLDINDITNLNLALISIHEGEQGHLPYKK